MKDILLRHDDMHIECEIKGLKMTRTHSDEPKRHTVAILKGGLSYKNLKREVNDIYRHEGIDSALDYLESADFYYKYFVDGSDYVYTDNREDSEIREYLEEATDKVWLMRSCDISREIPRNEVGRSAMRRILNKYDDIPRDGYDTWECGYWNGIMAALRWVLGDEKDYLDT